MLIWTIIYCNTSQYHYVFSLFIDSTRFPYLVLYKEVSLQPKRQNTCWHRTDMLQITFFLKTTFQCSLGSNFQFNGATVLTRSKSGYKHVVSDMNISSDKVNVSMVCTKVQCQHLVLGTRLISYIKKVHTVKTETYMYTSEYISTILQVSGMFRSVFVLTPLSHTQSRAELALGDLMNKHQLASGASQ